MEKHQVTQSCLSKIFSGTLNIHCCTLILQLPIKLLNPSHESLFDLLLTEILADIDIWLSGLEDHNKFKRVILSFKYVCNPVLFTITHDLWTLYHNIGTLCWYNKVKYNWSHRCILAREDTHWIHYQHYSTGYE